MYFILKVTSTHRCEQQEHGRGRVDDSFPLVTGREETPQVAYTVFDDSEFSLTERLKESQKVYMIFRCGGGGGGARITKSLTMYPQNSLELTTQNRLTLNS